MAILKRGIRGLQDIRTHSGSVDSSQLPHRTHMEIASLEMEKARRKTERESALSRVRTIDARFQEIEAEKARLLRALGKQDSEHTAPKATPRPDGEGIGFRLKY